MSAPSSSFTSSSSFSPLLLAVGFAASLGVAMSALAGCGSNNDTDNRAAVSDPSQPARDASSPSVSTQPSDSNPVDAAATDATTTTTTGSDAGSDATSTVPIKDGGVSSSSTCNLPTTGVYRVQMVPFPGSTVYCGNIDDTFDLTDAGATTAPTRGPITATNDAGMTCTTLSGSTACAWKATCTNANGSTFVSSFDSAFDPATGKGVSHWVADYTDDDAGAIIDCTWSETWTKL